jgi:DNA-binding CsgD family transcriptional regulator
LCDSVNFSTEIADFLQYRGFKVQKFNHIKRFPIVVGKQAMYIMDWQKSQLVYSRGIKKMLGYNRMEFTMQLALNCIHPEDLDVVNNIHRGVINLAINTDVKVQKLYLNITFRLLQKDGRYIRVMRQSSPYHTDEDGKLLSNLSILTDISFMKTNSNLVEWELFADKLDVSKFKQNVYKEFINFFTPREKEIINLIQNDFTNQEIASRLFISTHTVVSHRKNILKKSNCHNSKELLTFCELNGII